jgi:hypothetical protein
MRAVINGAGNNVASAYINWVSRRQTIFPADLYLIGYPEDPQALWLTNWQAPLNWKPWGTFYPATISRGTVTTKIGLDVQTLDITWTPKVTPYRQSIAAANAQTRLAAGYYDNLPVRVWSVYMPSPGDANTFGASELFGGRLGKANSDRGAVKWNASSFLDVISQNVPTNLIEVLNTGAAYAGASPPAGFSSIPQFNVIAGSSPNVLVLDAPGNGDIPAHHIFGTNVLQHGFVAFNYGTNSTLGGVWSAIQQNIQVTIGSTNYNQVVLYAPLPWVPTPGVDTCYISAASPINASDGEYFGFPYVPSPLTSA